MSDKNKREFWIKYLQQKYESYSGVWLSDDVCKELVGLLKKST